MSVYFLSDGNKIKIGYSDRVIERVSDLQTGNPDKLELIGLIPNGTKRTELSLKKRFILDKVRGEWFQDTPGVREEISRIIQQFNLGYK